MFRSIIFIITELFPFGVNTEKSFLQEEVRKLSKKFDKVIIAPQYPTKDQTTHGNFSIDYSLSLKLQKKTKFKFLYYALLNKYLYLEIFSRNIVFWNFHNLKRLIHFCAKSYLISDWCKNISFPKLCSKEKIVFYTYWNTEATLSIADFSLNKKSCRSITRAHGHDLYEFYYIYLPLYETKLRLIDKVFLISKHGFSYLESNYPGYRKKFELSYLGVKKAPKSIKQKNSDRIIVVSCSHMILSKKIKLLVEGIVKYSIDFNQKIRWVHFGDGPEYESIKLLCEKNQSELFQYELKGFIPNEEILRYYENNHVDIFVTTSETEGLPVTLQEALAYGIPIIATDVGGISEVVDESVGLLLCSHPNVAEIANAIDKLLKKSDQKKIKKIA